MVTVNVVDVLAISVGLAKLLVVDDCHLVTVPVCPLNVKVVEFVPVQTGDDPVVMATEPPTDVGLTSINCDAEFAAAQAPLVTTAR